MPTMLPLVALIRRHGQIFVISQCAPGDGTYRDIEPVFVLNSADTQTVGDSVLRAFGAFVVDNMGRNWQTWTSPVIRSAGVATWQEFEQGVEGDCIVLKHGIDYEVRSGNYDPIHLNSPSAKKLGEGVLYMLGIG